MSKELVERVLETGEDHLGGASQIASVLFSDIRSFTTISEALGARGTVSMLNEYFTDMVDVVLARGGILDKYIGDAIMALFTNADDAVRAGLAMLETLAAFNAERRLAGQPPIGIGIGINSGSLMLGTIGEKERMEGTVISDAVNLAARVEDLTKTYREPLLISEFTYQQLVDPKAYDIRSVDVVVVKGKTRPVTIYAVHSLAQARTSQSALGLSV